MRPLVHGAAYFRGSYEELCALRAGRPGLLHRLARRRRRAAARGGTEVGDVLARRSAGRGVEVRGLMWRSHSDRLRFSAQENQRLGAELNEAGGEVLLDQRVRRGGSHHQKLVVVRHRRAAERDVAFVGGIDLCHGRRDDADHARRPAAARRSTTATATAPPWHDVAGRDPRPGRRRPARHVPRAVGRPAPARPPHAVPRARSSARPHAAPPASRCPTRVPAPAAGRPARRAGAAHLPGEAAAATRSRREGERSIARAYRKAFAPRAQPRLRRGPVPLVRATSPRRSPRRCAATRELRLVAVRAALPRRRRRGSAGRRTASGSSGRSTLLRGAGGDRVAVYDLENDDGHADLRARQGLHRRRRVDHGRVRQPQPALVDARLRAHVRGRSTARATTASRSRPGRPRRRRPACSRASSRLQLWAEHLGLEPDDPRLVDPRTALELWLASARALDAWQRGRPGARVRRGGSATTSPSR